MTSPAVVDASPIIVLAKAGYLSLLRVVSDPVLVPREVAQEIHRRGSNDPGVQALGQTSWLVSVDPGPAPPLLQGWHLGAGELAALTYALANPGTEVFSDDAAARRCARAIGVPFSGTVGVVLEQLRQVGMYLSDRVMNQALTQVGE